MRAFIHDQRAHKKGDTHLEPECRTLAGRRELRGLEVGESECRQVATLDSKCGEAIDHDSEMFFVVAIVVIEVQKYFSVWCRNSSAHHAFDGNIV